MRTEHFVAVVGPQAYLIITTTRELIKNTDSLAHARPTESKSTGERAGQNYLEDFFQLILVITRYLGCIRKLELWLYGRITWRALKCVMPSPSPIDSGLIHLG